MYRKNSKSLEAIQKIETLIEINTPLTSDVKINNISEKQYQIDNKINNTFDAIVRRKCDIDRFD
jgi:hypothetical protein